MSQHIYTYDPANDQLNEIGGAGHIIKDENGTSFTKRENLQFDGMKVSDDATSNTTVVEAVETNFVGTWEEWEALTLAERAQYETVDLLDDFNGAPIDPTPTKDSINAVQSGGVYDALDPMLNKLGAKNLCPNNAATQVIAGVTFTVNSDGSVTANGTSTANWVNFQVANFALPKGKYILSGITGGDAGTYRFTLQGAGSDIVLYDGETEFELNSATQLSMTIIVRFSDVTVSDVTFYPMIRLASIEDDTYAPYSRTNQELAGEADAMLNVLGAKNLLPNYATSQTVSSVNYVVNSDGTVTSSGTCSTAWPTLHLVQYSNKVILKKGTYILSGCTGGSASGYQLVLYYSASGSSSGEVSCKVFDGSVVVNIPQDSYIRAFISSANANVNMNTTFKPMLRPASIADDTYAPYAKTNRELTVETDTWVAGTVTPASGVTLNTTYSYFRYNPKAKIGIVQLYITENTRTDYSIATLSGASSASNRQFWSILATLGGGTDYNRILIYNNKINIVGLQKKIGYASFTIELN